LATLIDTQSRIAEMEKGAAMSQKHYRRGTAAVALRRLAHPGRDGGVVGEGDQLFEVTRRLSELLAVVEHQTAEINDRAAPRPTESVGPSVPGRATPTPQGDDTGTATISLRFDTQVLSRVDAAAKRLGISRTAWLRLAARDLLGDRR
jgi:hypothetical protein